MATPQVQHHLIVPGGAQRTDDDTVARESPQQADGVEGVGRDHIGPVGIADPEVVRALATDQGVGPETAEQGVGTVTAEEEVVTPAARQPVIALPSVQRVGRAGTRQAVITPQTDQGGPDKGITDEGVVGVIGADPGGGGQGDVALDGVAVPRVPGGSEHEALDAILRQSGV